MCIKKIVYFRAYTLNLSSEGRDIVKYFLRKGPTSRGVSEFFSHLNFKIQGVRDPWVHHWLKPCRTSSSFESQTQIFNFSGSNHLRNAKNWLFRLPPHFVTKYPWRKISFVWIVTKSQTPPSDSPFLIANIYERPHNSVLFDTILMNNIIHPDIYYLCWQIES